MLTTLLFNECIKSGDLEGLRSLITGDHVFIDTQRSEVGGSLRHR